jgi:predicted acyltransferase
MGYFANTISHIRYYVRVPTRNLERKPLIKQEFTTTAPSVKHVKQLSDRLFSLDVFRGLTIAGMILVTDPGTYSATYHQLRHGAWTGATVTDMIFPAFLFIVGVSITLSFALRLERGADRRHLAWHILRRAIVLFVLGLALNGFPDYALHTLRLPGILQRIAVCYLCAGLLYLSLSKRRSPLAHLRSTAFVPIACITAGILALYWALLKWVPVAGAGPGLLDTQNSLPAYLDRLIIGTRHMWPWGLTPGVGVTFDPEGILSTFPAIASTLVGVLTGIWMRSPNDGKRKALGTLLSGIALAFLGLLLSHFQPLIKQLWTPTFALFSSGISLLLFTTLFVIVDLQRIRWWTPPALVLGTNAILAFALSTIITVLTVRIHVTSAHLSLRDWGYQHLAAWLSPLHASLAWAMVVVVFNIAIIVPLYLKRIFVKI